MRDTINLTSEEFTYYLSLPQERVYADNPLEQALIDKGVAVTVTGSLDNDSGVSYDHLITKEQFDEDRRRDDEIDWNALHDWETNGGAIPTHPLITSSGSAPLSMTFVPGTARVCWFNDILKQTAPEGYFVYVTSLTEVVLVVNTLSYFELAMGDTTDWNVWTLEVMDSEGRWSDFEGPFGESIEEMIEMLNVDKEQRFG